MTDLDQIRRTIAEHPQTLDDGDVDRYVSLFIEEARLTAGGTEYVGQAAIRGFIKGYFESQQPGRQTRHMFGNSVIDLEGEQAKSVSDVMIYARADDGQWALATLTRHHDRLVRNGDRWLFAAKEIRRR
jgi:3-phenylpropionate/cinnamic acid dioxygenase small subunit